MDFSTQPTSSQEAARDRAEQQLQVVFNELKEARRILRRDWEQMTPRERSSQSRVVKDLEDMQRKLEDEVEMNNVG